MSATRCSAWAASLIVVSIAQVSPGSACSSAKPIPTDEELLARASAVVVAHLTSVEEIDVPANMKGAYNTIVEASVSTIESIKGSPPKNGKVRSAPFGYGNCTLPLLAGADYILFLNEKDPYITSLSGSTGPILNLDAVEVRERLAKLRSLAK